MPAYSLAGGYPTLKLSLALTLVDDRNVPRVPVEGIELIAVGALVEDCHQPGDQRYTDVPGRK